MSCSDCLFEGNAGKLYQRAIDDGLFSVRDNSTRPTGVATLNGPLLIVVEGANDIQFLVRLSARLRLDLPSVPDLSRWQTEGRLAFVPVGGGDPASWPARFLQLNLSEFHLYDREQLPESDVRQRAIDRVNAGPQCRGALTSKRAMENDLSPRAISAAGGGDIAYGDDEPVCSLLAQHWYSQKPASQAWKGLPRRTQGRLAAHAKRWLNTIAVQQMTAEWLAERDPAGEALGWLHSIRELVEPSYGRTGMHRFSEALA
jgi:hypothetical protein